MCVNLSFSILSTHVDIMSFTHEAIPKASDKLYPHALAQKHKSIQRLSNVEKFCFNLSWIKQKQSVNDPCLSLLKRKWGFSCEIAKPNAICHHKCGMLKNKGLKTIQLNLWQIQSNNFGGLYQQWLCFRRRLCYIHRHQTKSVWNDIAVLFHRFPFHAKFFLAYFMI
jgi:hypothetical protein